MPEPSWSPKQKAGRSPFHMSLSKLQVADALKECELFPPSEMLLALCVLLLIEEIPSQPPAGDHFRHVHREPAMPAKVGFLKSCTLTPGHELMSKKISRKTHSCKQMAPFHLIERNEKNQTTFR